MCCLPLRLLKKVEKSDWTTLLIALSDNISFQTRGVVNRMSLPEIFKAIKQKLGIPEEESTLIAHEAEKDISMEVGNEWDELVFDDLDPEDRSEFRELKEAIDAKRAETFQEHWDIIRKSMTTTRRRGRPKKEGEEKRKVNVKGNVKVKRKWLKRIRVKKPLEDEEEQEPKKQKTSGSSNEEHVEEDFPSMSANPDQNHLLFEENQEAATSSNQEDLTSELASALSNATQGRTSGAEKDITSALAASSTNEDALTRSGQNAEAGAVSSSDIVVPLQQISSPAPRSPGGVSQMSINSRASHRPNLSWQSVFCPTCEYEYGQYKYDPCPGSRDPPTWTYRVADEEGVCFFLIFIF